jgi:SAM-dependent methyltransferase
MDRDAFELMAKAERTHWWFRGRRHFIERALRTVTLPADARLLDAGCGSGGNLELLSRFGRVWGFEYDAEACAVAGELGLGPVERGGLPGPIPFSDVQFHAIGLFDVLEHLEHPVESLIALRERVTSDGALVLTVPALPWLWGPHDEVHQHFRRYTASTLRRHLEDAGWEISYLSYFNTVLFPLALLQRARERIFGYRVDSLTPSPAVNALLFRLWRLEEPFIPRATLPIGLSLLAVARPRGAT